YVNTIFFFFFFSSRRRHTRSDRDWSSDECSSDLTAVCRREEDPPVALHPPATGGSAGPRAHPVDIRAVDSHHVLLVTIVAVPLEIGRASCRERVYISAGAGVV